MSWYSYKINFSGTQGQSQEPFEEASNTMASYTDNISEFAELDPLFEGLEAFTADHLLDFLSREGTSDDTSSSPGNAPPTLGLPTVVGENNPYNFQPFNGGSNRSSNDSETSSSPESPLVCPWPGCPHRKPFSNKATLKRHYYFIHVAPGSFPCDKCHSTFNRKDNLKKHLGSIHPE